MLNTLDVKYFFTLCPFTIIQIEALMPFDRTSRKKMYKNNARSSLLCRIATKGLFEGWWFVITMPNVQRIVGRHAKSLQFQALGITRYNHIERKEDDVALISFASLHPKNTFKC